MLALTSQKRPPKHPITLGLRDAIFDPVVAQHGSLVKDHFLRIIDAREADLADPLSPPTLADLEQYAESTSSRMLYLLLNLQGLSDPRVDELFSHLGRRWASASLLHRFRTTPTPPHALEPEEAGLLACRALSTLRKPMGPLAHRHYHCHWST